MNQITENFMLRLVLLAYLPYMCQYYKGYFKQGMLHNFFSYLRKLSMRLLILLILKIITFSNYSSFGWFEILGLIFMEMVIILFALAADQVYFYVQYINHLGHRGSLASHLRHPPSDFLRPATHPSLLSAVCSLLPLLQHARCLRLHYLGVCI